MQIELAKVLKLFKEKTKLFKILKKEKSGLLFNRSIINQQLCYRIIRSKQKQ